MKDESTGDAVPKRNFAQEQEELVQELSQDEEHEELVAEINVLQSIYGENSIGKWQRVNAGTRGSDKQRDDGRVRYEVHLSLSDDLGDEDTDITILVTLPLSYPKTGPPQLQLLSLYIGAFGVDSGLFGAVLRTYISQGGVEWTPETICVFDGIENVKERCLGWYKSCLSEEKANEILREDEKELGRSFTSTNHDVIGGLEETNLTEAPSVSLPPGVDLVTAEPVTDRKSVFVGRACRIVDPSQVPLILSYLMSDRRIARAAHPIINAWRCTVNGVLHQDNDDDGESAAGGRLAHLLQILELEDVLVVVTRYFGAILLGADRFKHINQAARNALEIGGFLDAEDDKKGAKHRKKR